MPSPTKQNIAAFMEKFFGLMTDVEGKQGVRVDALEALVKSDLEAAAGAVFILLQAEQQMRGARQLAFSVAAIYEKITGDDSLTRRARRVIEEAGGRLPTFKSSGGQAAASPPVPQLAAIQVDAGDLERGDIYNVQRLCRVNPADPTKDLTGVSALRGRCLLAFPSLDKDPRPVWQVPEARTFVRKLFEAMPYFPYYLNLMPESGSFMLFFGCLADLKAFLPVGEGDQNPKGLQRILEIIRGERRLKRLQGLATPAEESVAYLNVLHPSVVEAVSTSLVAVTELCRSLGEDPRGVQEQLLAPYAPEVRKAVLACVN